MRCWFPGKAGIGVLQNVSEVRKAEVFREEGVCGKEETTKERIKVGARIDVQAVAECARKAQAGGLIIDLTDLSELSPAGLNCLHEAREFTEVDFVLPQHPTHRRFFEFLGFGGYMGHGVADDIEPS